MAGMGRIPKKYRFFRGKKKMCIKTNADTAPDAPTDW
jgi:hypothetical protein